MSYQRLMLCVDNSGSMSGPKIRNSIKYLTEIAVSFDCTTNYFKFGNSVEEVHDYNTSTLPCDDGTRIEYCLGLLFEQYLPRYCNGNERVKFIFVTDAEDCVRNVSNCIQQKKQCESRFNNKLDCYCLLTGANGGCSNELKQIFGAQSFDHCDDKNFKTILQKICGNNKTANKLSTVDLKNVHDEVQKLKQSTDEDKKEMGQDMDNILQSLNTIKQKTQRATEKIDASKRNIASLNAETASVSQAAHSAVTEEDCRTAYGQVRTIKRGYRTEERQLTAAGKDLDESGKALEAQSQRAEQMAAKLKSNGDEISNTATAIIANIIGAIKQLTEIEQGAYEQVQRLRADFRNQLENLVELVNGNNTLSNQLDQLSGDIDAAFNDFKYKRTELNGFKTQITNKMKELNDLLQLLDSK